MQVRGTNGVVHAPIPARCFPVSPLALLGLDQVSFYMASLAVVLVARLLRHRTREPATVATATYRLVWCANSAGCRVTDHECVCAAPQAVTTFDMSAARPLPQQPECVAASDIACWLCWWAWAQGTCT